MNTFEFFEKDTVYIEDVGPFRAPETYTEFDCRAVITSPANGELLAVGFGRQCDQVSQPWNLCAYSKSIWDRGWIVKPEKEKG